MEYRIVLNRMEFRAFHGCYDLEQQVGNRFTVDLEITAELGEVASEDCVEKAVNYLLVYETVREQMRVTQRMPLCCLNIVEQHRFSGRLLMERKNPVLRSCRWTRDWIQVICWRRRSFRWMKKRLGEAFLIS